MSVRASLARQKFRSSVFFIVAKSNFMMQSMIVAKFTTIGSSQRSKVRRNFSVQICDEFLDKLLQILRSYCERNPNLV